MAIPVCHLFTFTAQTSMLGHLLISNITLLPQCVTKGLLNADVLFSLFYKPTWTISNKHLLHVGFFFLLIYISYQTLFLICRSQLYCVMDANWCMILGRQTLWSHPRRYYWARVGLGPPILGPGPPSDTALVFILAVHPISSMRKALSESFSTNHRLLPHVWRLPTGCIVTNKWSNEMNDNGAQAFQASNEWETDE